MPRTVVRSHGLHAWGPTVDADSAYDDRTLQQGA